MPKKLTRDQFIQRANEIHNHFYDYSKVQYKNCDTKVCIIDPEYGKFWQIPYSHLKGHKCMKRNGSIKLTTKDFIQRSNKIHSGLYDYSKVKYIDAKTKICIIDPEMESFGNYHLTITMALEVLIDMVTNH